MFPDCVGCESFALLSFRGLAGIAFALSLAVRLYFSIQEHHELLDRRGVALQFSGIDELGKSDVLLGIAIEWPQHRDHDLPNASI